MNERSTKKAIPKTDWKVLKSREFLYFVFVTFVVVLLKPFFMAGLILICNIDLSGISLYILTAAFLFGSTLAFIQMVRFGKINRAHMRQGHPSLPIPTIASSVFALFIVLTIASIIDASVWTSLKDLGVRPIEISRAVLEITYGIKI